VVVVRLNRPGPRTSLGFQCSLRGWIEAAVQGQIRKTLLCRIWMFVALVWTERG